MNSTTEVLPGVDLARFKALQRLAYDCAETVARELQPGVTEKQVAQKMKVWLLDHGVDDWFHQPFAWFGDRTAFRGFRGFNPRFFPSSRRLEENMPYILDCAPVQGGAVADIGYSGCLGHNPMLEQLMDDLAAHRELILRLIRQRQSMAEVSRAVDRLCVSQGVEPRHKAYPFSVLAHQVGPLDERSRRFSVARFGVRSVVWLSRAMAAGQRKGQSPLWSSGKRSDHAPMPGLWAVEPHLGFYGVGAKFEELLVITDTNAWWLDDDLPHVRRWQERQDSQAEPGPVLRLHDLARASAPKSSAARSSVA